MARGARSTVVTVKNAVLRRWDRVPMRVQARITVALPLVAVVVSACLAISGNMQRIEIQTDLQRRFEMSAALGGLSSLMVNAETGMRGYLLTREDAFLEPFDQATRELPSAVGRLTELVADEPGDEPRARDTERLRDLTATADRQMADLAFQRSVVVGGGDPAGPEIRRHLEYGKGLMDRIRAEVGEMQARQRALLDARIADIDAIRVRDYVAVALVLVVALATRFAAWFLFRNGTLRRVERLTEVLRARRAGLPAALPPSTKQDHLGELEREVGRLDA